MAGAIPEMQLIRPSLPTLLARTRPAPGRFEVATAADDAEIRRLLRDNAMDGSIQISLEREPHAAIAASIENESSQTIVARRPGGGLYATGTRGMRSVYVNGQVTRVGYLGGLRLDRDHRSNPRALLGGFKLFQQLHEADGRTRLYLTSIMRDNHVARRFLEANLRGMPTYRHVHDLVTLIMPLRRRKLVARQWPSEADRTTQPTVANFDEFEAFLARHQSRWQFATHWPRESLERMPPGLSRDATRITMHGDKLATSAAVWDQRPFKQSVVRGCAPSFKILRPCLNAISHLSGAPKLPPVGKPMKLGYVTQIATSCDGGDDEAIVEVIASLNGVALQSGLDYLACGFPAGDARYFALRRRFGGYTLHSRLYVVFWPDGREAADALDNRPSMPDIATL